jgi:hypothetical protein
MIRKNSPQFARTVLVSFAAIALVATSATSALAGSGGFNNTGSMDVARDGHTATLLANGEVLVAGGENNSTGFLSSAELYNPSTGKWTLTGSLAVARFGHNAVRLANGQVLLAGGLDPNACCGAPSLATAELYNPSTGAWTATGSMSVGRYQFALTLLPNGEVLAAGGDNSTSAELYNPMTGTWTSTGSMATVASSAGSVLLQNGQVFLFGPPQLYNSTTGTWTATTSPSQGGSGPFVLLQNGNVFVDGDLYNPSTAQWTLLPPPPCTTSKQNCEAAGALLKTGKVLVAGGITSVNAQPYPIAETNGLAALFDPSTLTWTTTGSMNISRIAQAMTLLPNGQVLVSGGETFVKHLGHLVPIASAELYTP